MEDDDRGIEIDEFAMFQARSMGVETEYLEMAKAGRHAGRSPRVHRGGGDECGPAPSTSAGRRHQQRSTEGRQRSGARNSRSGGEDELGSGSPRTSRHSSDSGRQHEGSSRAHERTASETSRDEGSDRDRSRGATEEQEQADKERHGNEGNDDDGQPLQRSHSYRSKRAGNKQPWTEQDAKTGGVHLLLQPDSDERCGDLKRTLTMPAKRQKDRARFRESDGALRNDASIREDEEMLQARHQNDPEAEGQTYSKNGCDGSDRRTKQHGVAWKDGGGTNGHNPRSSPSSSTQAHGESGRRSNAAVARHDSRGSCKSGSPATPESGEPRPRNCNDANEPNQFERGGSKTRVAAMRVERPVGDDVTVYKVLVLGSQGVGKTTVTQQLLSAGCNDDFDDDSDNRIVSVLVDDDESFLEFTDSVSSQANRAKQCADANLVVYSVTDRSSFAFAQSCLQELRPAKRHNVVILVANKQDLVRNRVISEEDGKNLAAKRHCKFIEVSALLSLKMDELLIGIARQIRLRKGRTAPAPGVAAAAAAASTADGDAGASHGGGFDNSLGCLQRAALHAIRKVFRRRPVESTSCDNLCTP